MRKRKPEIDRVRLRKGSEQRQHLGRPAAIEQKISVGDEEKVVVRRV